MAYMHIIACLAELSQLLMNVATLLSNAGSLTGVGPLVPTVTRVHASLHVYAVNLNVYVPD